METTVFHTSIVHTKAKLLIEYGIQVFHIRSRMDSLFAFFVFIAGDKEMVAFSFKQSFLRLRKQSSTGRKETRERKDCLDSPSATDSDTEDSNDGSMAPLQGRKKSVRFSHEEVYSYPSPLEKVSKKELFWRPSELQDLQSEQQNFAKIFWKQNSEYVNSLETLFRNESSFLSQAHRVDCLIWSPVRGLENQMSAVFRIQRRWMQRRIFQLQADSIDAASLENAEMISEASQTISRPSREFALKIGLGDAKIASLYQGSNEDDDFILPELEESEMSFEASCSSLIDI